jgi:hypothetical protein
MSSVLRPDEEAAEERIRQNKRMNSIPGNIAKAGVSTILGGGAVSAGLKMASKIAPFLSEHIPLDLAMKGISKLSPQLGKFLQKGQSMGLDIKEGLDMLRDKVAPKEPEQKKKTNQQIDIGQYSPDLQAFIEHWLSQGEEPATAAAVAKNVPQNQAKFKAAIDKIEADTGEDFIELVGKMYQGVNKGKKAQQGQQAAMPQKAQPQGQVPALAQQTGAPAQQRQPTENEINLTKALQDLTKRLGK